MLQIKSANLDSLLAQRAMGAGQSQLTESVRRLSSGRRINSAKDDAAGLGISQELQRQIRGTTMASRNANDAISMLRTADGGLAEVGNMLQRMKELSVQGANESLTVSQRQFITAELGQLKKEINAIANNTRYNNINLLNGDYAEVVRGKFNTQFQIGSWVNVSGVNQTHDSGALRAILTSTAGPMRLTDTSNISAVTGYTTLGSSRYNTDTKQHEMAFTGTADQINTALATLQAIKSPGEGNISVKIEKLLWSSSNYDGQLEPAVTESQTLVQDFFSQTTAQEFFDLFNGAASTASTEWLDAARNLRGDILNGKYSVNVQYLDSSTMQGAMGAFAKSGPGGTPTIFLNRDWIVDSRTSKTDISAVLIEELGHSIDARLNTTDTPGDEGELFSYDVRGISLNAAVRSAIQTENDHQVFSIDGIGYSVETALLSVPFQDGYSGSNVKSNGATSVVTFTTLSISKAFFIQNSSGNTFVYTGTQGNDIGGILRLQLNSGQIIDINGAIKWEKKDGGKTHTFGFIPDVATSVSLTKKTGGTYTITGSSSIGLEKVGSTYSYKDGDTIQGDAAGVLNELNSYLASLTSVSPKGPVTVNSSKYSSTDPIVITGSVTLAAGESLSVVVNGVNYTTSSKDGSGNNVLVVSGNTWTLSIPSNPSNPTYTLADGTYDVTATITNGAGYTLSDTSSSELRIGSSFPPLLISSGPVDNQSGVSVDSNITFTFDSPIFSGSSGTIRLYKSNGTLVETFDPSNPGGTLLISGNTLTINPTNDLSVATGYYVLIDSGALTGTNSSDIFAGISDPAALNFTTVLTNTVYPPPTVADITVNESSPYAIFTIDATAGQQLSLALQDGTALMDADGSGTNTSYDYSSAMEYWNGTQWMAYTTGSQVTVPSDGNLLVRTKLVNDTVAEGSLTFNLVVTPYGGSPITATATINDQGQGTIFGSGNPNIAGGITLPVIDTNATKGNDFISSQTISLTGGGTGLELTNTLVNGADPGIYRFFADPTGKTVTLLHYDMDGQTLLGSETIDLGSSYQIGAGKTSTLDFSHLGVTVSLQNFYDHAIGLGDPEGGLVNPLTVAVSQTESRIGERGFIFQTGEQSPREHAIISFRDIRLDGNTDQFERDKFNRVGILLSSIRQSTDYATLKVGFQSLESALDDVISQVSARRSEYGANENRLLYNINNLSEQTIGLNFANSKIQDTDFAWEVARLARLQIGQQAATAMLAQTNILPRMVSSLLAATELTGIG